MRARLAPMQCVNRIKEALSGRLETIRFQAQIAKSQRWIGRLSATIREDGVSAQMEARCLEGGLTS